MLIDSNSIHPKLLKFIFPFSPESWESTQQFYIEDNTCILIMDEKKPPQKIEPSIQKEDFEVIAMKTQITKVSEKDNAKVKDEKNEEENKVEPLSHELLFNDLVQFYDEKLSVTFLHDRHKSLDNKKNLQEGFVEFASTCLEEYDASKLKYPNLKFLENARMYSKLLLGILYANNLCVCTLGEFKKLKELTLQDMEDLKIMLQNFDVYENEVIEIVSEAHRKKFGLLLVLFNCLTMRIEGVSWSEGWDQSKEKNFVEIKKMEDKEYEDDDEKEEEVPEFNSLYIKTIALKRENVMSNGLRSLMHTLILSENQHKKYQHVVWKPMKTGEFPNLKEMLFFENTFGYQSLFKFQEGLKKFPKQEMLLENYENDLLLKQKHVYISKFLAKKGLKNLELAKKYKLIKEDYPGIWKDFENEIIEIRLKKKDCFSNIFLELIEFPKPSEFLGQFLLFKEMYQEKESLTSIENNLL